MKQFKSIFFILVLTSTSGQFFSDLYLPSIPAISKALETTAELSQLTVSIYLLGYCISSIIYGPISDTFGRKKPLLLGLTLSLIGSFICIFSPNIFILILGRLLQGMGGGAGITITSAIIRDCIEGEKMAKFSSYLTMANMVVIIAAPILGGYFQIFFDWNASFQFLFVYSFIVLILVGLFVPETKDENHRVHLKLKTYLNSISQLFKARQFAGYTVCLFCSYGGIMAWLTCGPTLTQNYLHLTPSNFGWMCFTCGISYTFGAFINSKLVTLKGIEKMFNMGIWLMFIGGCSMLVLSTMLFNVLVILLPLMLCMAGIAMIMPNSYAGALAPFLKIAGFAVAVLAGSQILGGVISSMLMAFLPDNSQIPLALILIACSVAIFLSKRFMIIKTT